MIDPLAYCLGMLKRRLCSRRELIDGMTRKGIEASAQEVTLASLTENGLVDDLRYARAWIHTRDILAPRGGIVLRQELMQKGISREIIDQVLSERKEQAEDEEMDEEAILA